MLLSRTIRQRALPRMLNPSSLPLQSRSIFSVPTLGEGQSYTQEGIGKLMSPEQFRIAWTENQGRLVDELNRLTDGTPYSNQSTKSVLLQTARDPDQAQLFNYASMAHNNHFFFTTLSAKPTRPSERFGQELEKCFSSASAFRAMFLASAEAMFAPGFVWLVNDASAVGGNKFAIVNTYAAGSPYPGAAFRKQEQQAATTDHGVRPDNSFFGRGYGFARGQNSNVLPGAFNANPLMCLSTWEHMYLRDFGVKGKREYLEAWWDSIDWQKVEKYCSTEDGQARDNAWRV